MGPKHPDVCSLPTQLGRLQQSQCLDYLYITTVTLKSLFLNLNHLISLVLKIFFSWKLFISKHFLKYQQGTPYIIVYKFYHYKMYAVL